MGIEIERKFLVADDSWKRSVRAKVEIRQGYFRAEDSTIRVRIRADEGILTIKGKTVGVRRGEWEWPIPTSDAEELITEFCGLRTIEKTRHFVDVEGHEWVVDVFHGRHSGLVLAEIELTAEDEAFEEPGWVGDEVSHDPRYFNSNLARPDNG